MLEENTLGDSPENASNPAQTHEKVFVKYKLTLIAVAFSVLTFAIGINLVPLLFVPIMYGLYEFPWSHMSLLIFISFGTQMIILLACSKIPDKVGLRPILVCTCGMVTLGFILLFLTPIIFGNHIFVGLLLAVIVYGVAAGFLNAMLNPIINSLPFKNKERAMTLFHTSFAALSILSILGTTLAIYFLPYIRWNFIPLAWAVVPLIALILWTKAPLIALKKKGIESATSADVNSSINLAHKPLTTDTKKSSGKKTLLLILFAMTVAMASEAILGKGSSAYIDAGLAVPKLIGDLLGPIMFTLFLGLGRLLFGLFGNKHNMRTFMIFGSLTAFVLYVFAALTPIPALGVAAIALSGFAVSLLVPGMITQTGKDYAHGGATIFIILNAAGKIGAAGGPGLFGLLGDILSTAFGDLHYRLGLTERALGLRAALLICAIFPLVSFILQWILHKKQKKELLAEEALGAKNTTDKQPNNIL